MSRIKLHSLYPQERASITLRDAEQLKQFLEVRDLREEYIKREMSKLIESSREEKTFNEQERTFMLEHRIYLMKMIQDNTEAKSTLKAYIQQIEIDDLKKVETHNG